MKLDALIQETRPRVDGIIQDSLSDVPPVLQHFRRLLVSELSQFKDENLYLLPVLIGKMFGNGDLLFLYWGGVFELFVEAIGFLDNLPTLFSSPENNRDESAKKQEATHLLASDALIPQAFKVLSNDAIWEAVPHEVVFKSLQELSYSISSQGLLRGLLAQSELEKFETLDQMENITAKKTGILFGTLSGISARLAQSTDGDREKSFDLGKALGTAFPVARFLRIRNKPDDAKYGTYLQFFSGLQETELYNWLSDYRDQIQKIVSRFDQPSKELLAQYCDTLLLKDSEH